MTHYSTREATVFTAIQGSNALLHCAITLKCTGVPGTVPSRDPRLRMARHDCVECNESIDLDGRNCKMNNAPPHSPVSALGALTLWHLPFGERENTYCIRQTVGTSKPQLLLSIMGYTVCTALALVLLARSAHPFSGPVTVSSFATCYTGLLPSLPAICHSLRSCPATCYVDAQSSCNSHSLRSCPQPAMPVVDQSSWALPFQFVT